VKAHSRRRLQTILDLDLDFFVWPIAYMPDNNTRLSEEADGYRSSSPRQVRRFLESRCHLSARRKIPGHEITDHVDAFFTWRRWLRSGHLLAPFNVVHVDAHADLGMGDGGWPYLLSELLALPVTQRRHPKTGCHGLNSGNFLAFAIANRWIRELTYVFPTRRAPKLKKGPPIALKVFHGDDLSQIVNLEQGKKRAKRRPIDLMWMHFRDFDTEGGLIELKRYSPGDVRRVVDPVAPTPLSIEPAVPFTYIASDRFRFSGFTHMTLAQSPQFTPPSADALLPICRDYFFEA
jgi:hypothetical protein